MSLPPGGWFWVFGFPAEMAEPLPAPSIFGFDQLFMLAARYEGESYLENYDADCHFLLQVHRDDLVTPDGRPGYLPDRLEGVSGCSVWWTPSPRDVSPASWRPDTIRAVGVETSYYRRPSLIKATRWGAVANLLYRVRPDLRPVIRLHFGD